MLTENEKLVLNDLKSAWNRFVGLDEHGYTDREEFMDAIHAAQKIIALRIARRCDKDVWEQPPKKPTLPTPEEVKERMDKAYEEIKKDEAKLLNILEKKRKQRRREYEQSKNSL